MPNIPLVTLCSEKLDLLAPVARLIVWLLGIHLRVAVVFLCSSVLIVYTKLLEGNENIGQLTSRAALVWRDSLAAGKEVGAICQRLSDQLTRSSLHLPKKGGRPTFCVPLGPAVAGSSTAEREEEKEATRPYMSATIGLQARHYSNLRAFRPEPQEEEEAKQQEQFCLQD